MPRTMAEEDEHGSTKQQEAEVYKGQVVADQPSCSENSLLQIDVCLGELAVLWLLVKLC